MTHSTPAIRAALKGHDPTPEQWAAITHPLEHVHLIAGAGSGKTAVMAARIAWIIEKGGYGPSQILGLTFTNKAAEELQERVRTAVSQMKDGRPEEISVQTYHSFAAGIVRDYGLLIGLEQDASLLTEAQQWQLVLSCMDSLPPFDAIELRSSAGVVRSTLKLTSALADHVLGANDIVAFDELLAASKETTEEIRTNSKKRIELARAVVAYQQAKRARNRIDYGDQVTKAVQILKEHPDVSRSYREQFPVVLLDEYQDTNVAQRLLMEEIARQGSVITAVGDTRQAIYAFRGATMYNLIDFPEHFARPGAARYAEVSLPENFRSGSRILAVANNVVSKIPAERRPGDDLRPHPSNGEGSVALSLFEDDRTEADWIARQCERLHDSPTAPERAPVGWRDIAILVRRKSSMGPILDALEARAIPVEVVGLSGLLKTPEVTEIVAWLKCLDTKPGANRWLARILLGPRWRISYRDLALCARWAADQNWDFKLKLAGGDQELARDMEPGDVGFSLSEALEQLDQVQELGAEARRRLADFTRRLSELRLASNLQLLDLVQEIMSVSGLADALAASPSRAAPAARQNVAAFVDYVAGFAPVEGEANLRSFLAYLDAAEDAEETLEAAQPAGGDSVKLMTIHSAKGLEFECVFVPAVAAKKNRVGEHVYSIFPETRASNPLTSYTELPYEVREDNEHLPKFKQCKNLGEFKNKVKERVIEDERRLFYVALTRAKQRLSVSASWWYGREGIEKGPSQFWEDLEELVPSGLVELANRADRPDTNPVHEALEDHRRWPVVARHGGDDSLFREGWGAAADTAFAGGVEPFLALLSAPERAAAEARLKELTAELESLATADDKPAAGRETRIFSATDFVRLTAEQTTAAQLARSLPERPSSDRFLGTEIHRLIEERSLDLDEGPSLVPFAEEADLDRPEDPDRELIAEKLARWEELGFAGRRLARLESGVPMVELPFALRIDGAIVRGRIDAIFETDDGLEIVDYKSGARFEPGDVDQLSIYARALQANGLLPDGASVKLTYAFLDGGEPLTRTWRPGVSASS